MNFALFFALLFSLNAFAESMRYDCALYFPASEQGQERFAKIAFPETGGALFEISDLTSPFRDIGADLTLKHSFYSDDDEMVGAQWTGANGHPAVDLSLAFFGTFWVGHVTFHQPVQTPELKFTPGEEIDFRCSENPY